MQATGVQIDGETLRWASVSKTWRGIRVGELCSSAHSNVKPLDLSTKRIISGLGSNDVILRSSAVAVQGNRKFRQALMLQTEAQLHFDSGELIILPRIHIKDQWAEIFSTTHRAVEKHLQELGHFGIDPERVSSIAAALQAFIEWKAPEAHTYFLIDIGWEVTHCIWVERGLIQKAHAIHFGMQHLKQAWVEDRKKTVFLSIKDWNEVDFSTLKAGLYPALAEEARTLRREIAKLLHSFQCQKPLLLTGEAEGLREFLMELLRDFVSEELNIGLSIEEQRYASCIGLSIDYLENRKDPLQFRTAADLARSTWELLGKYSALLLAAFFFLAAGIYQVGTWWMDQRETEINRTLETWTASRDPAIRQELFTGNGSSEDLVYRWLRLIEKNSKDYPFIMKAPLVSEFLNWLTRHPLIESFQLAKDPVSFKSLRYELVSLPRLGSEQDPYLAKVEIDFQIASPLHARQLHQSLLSEESLVDTSQEVTWEVLDNGYRASFYLKDHHGHF